MAARPPTRSLVRQLRSSQRVRGLRLVIGGVTAVPDASHVTIDLNGDGDTLTVPRLTGFTPVAGDAAYCIATPSLVICIGVCK